MTYGRQHKQSYNIINSFLLYYHGKTETILNYKSTFGLTEGKKYNCDAKVNTSPREQYGGIVHLFRHKTQPMRNYNYALYIYY